MRRLLAGILLFVCCFPIIALAETKGEVESIGFQGLYRPNCHIPMLVRLQTDKSGTYQIRVVQEDMDRDQQLFTAQQVSLTGSEDGKGGEQRFWLYFIPQPTEGGLIGGSLRDLQQQLKVFLCDEKGRQIVQLPVTQTITNVESPPGTLMANTRGSRLILAVSDSLTQQPVWHDYNNALGVMENVVFATVRSMDMPEDVRGYESVDAIVWLNAAAPDPAKATDEKRYHALRQYVRAGGHLVICQPPQREATATFDDLMPVKVTVVSPRDSLEPLKTLATEKLTRQIEREKNSSSNLPPAEGETIEETLRGPGVTDWGRPRGPFMYARAEPKPGAIIEELIEWSTLSATTAPATTAATTTTATTNPAQIKDTSPWLARIGYGAGCVSWVAQDLTDLSIISRAKTGWPFVWERVLDYKSDMLLLTSRTTVDQKRPYDQGGVVDLSNALLEKMELTSKARGLVSIAVVFFIAYWVVAGPGVYFYLLTKSRPQLSWFLFAFSALAATVLTVLVVKLVVRGSPELAHVTVIRTAPGEPTICFSRFGLYIPRDGAQEIKLPDVAPKEVSYLTAYPEHPAHAQGDIEFPAQIPYVVPLRDANSDDPVALSVPYRATLKKFQARRVGAVAGAIDGRPRLRKGDANFALLEGILTNGTGRKLRNVYFVYNDPQRDDDQILFLPTWEKGASIKLEDDFSFKSAKLIGLESDNGSVASPRQGYKIRGEMARAGIDAGWSRFWFSSDAPLRSGNVNAVAFNDSNEQVPKSFPMMSLFQRLPPMKNYASRGDRAEILRRGGRYLDVSNQVAAGRLVVLAEVEGDAELPFPLEVEGEKVAGKGRIFYQCALALDHQGGTEMPTTEPVGEQESMSPPPFDPATYQGNGSDLSPQDQQAWMRYRIQQRNQPRQPPRRQPTPRPQPPPRQPQR